MSNVTKFVHADLPIGDKEIDCYMMPSGEKRIGVTGASLAIGKAKNYLGRLLGGTSKQLEDLTSKGFTGYLEEGRVLRKDKSGSSIAKTISVRDFTKLIAFDAINNRTPDSIVLLAAFAETGLDYILELLFQGRSIEFLLEKIEHYSTWTNEELQEVLLYNREELMNLRLGI